MPWPSVTHTRAYSFTEIRRRPFCLGILISELWMPRNMSRNCSEVFDAVPLLLLLLTMIIILGSWPRSHQCKRRTKNDRLICLHFILHRIYECFISNMMSRWLPFIGNAHVNVVDGDRLYVVSESSICLAHISNECLCSVSIYYALCGRRMGSLRLHNNVTTDLAGGRQRN